MLADGLETGYLVETDLSSVMIEANTPNVLVDVTIARGGTIVNQETSLEICFSTTNPVPENSKLTVSLPYD